MKISEAKRIVGDMIEWVMFHEGILDERPQNMNYSLEDMIMANKMVDSNNKKQKIKNGSRTLSMTVDDRLIAAQYVAMNFEGNPSNSASSIAEANGKYVFVLK